MAQGERSGSTVGEIRRKAADLKEKRSHFPSVSKARERRGRELEVELTKLRNRLAHEIHAVVPSCHNCGGTDIRIKTSSHLVNPGNDIVGPAGRGPSYATHVDGLYCENCGEFYFNDKVAALESILSDIRQAENRLRAASSGRNFRC